MIDDTRLFITPEVHSPTVIATATVINVAQARRGARSVLTALSLPGPPNRPASQVTAATSGGVSA